jgi:YidC/Oxa1 family membrane protein insertase
LFDTFVTLPMQQALTFFYMLTQKAGYPSYGIAIILLTAAIKLVLYPLTVKQVKSMKSVQEIQPKVKALQEKYKDNKEKLQSEIAALYKANNVNPLSGCLPLIVQMPLLMGIFFAIKEYQYEGPTKFLWIANLQQGTSFSDPSDPYFIIPLLCAVTTYVQQKQTTTEMTQQNKMMLIFMPLFIGYITITFPAGLGIYWVVSNFVQILQQWFMNRKTTSA